MSYEDGIFVIFVSGLVMGGIMGFLIGKVYGAYAVIKEQNNTPKFY